MANRVRSDGGVCPKRSTTEQGIGLTQTADRAPDPLNSAKTLISFRSLLFLALSTDTLVRGKTQEERR